MRGAASMNPNSCAFSFVADIGTSEFAHDPELSEDSFFCTSVWLPDEKDKPPRVVRPSAIQLGTAFRAPYPDPQYFFLFVWAVHVPRGSRWRRQLARVRGESPRIFPPFDGGMSECH